jgi:hypothetical protein
MSLTINFIRNLIRFFQGNRCRSRGNETLTLLKITDQKMIWLVDDHSMFD